MLFPQPFHSNMSAQATTNPVNDVGRTTTAPSLSNLLPPPPSPALHPARSGPLLTGTLSSETNPFFAAQVSATLSRSSSSSSLRDQVRSGSASTSTQPGDDASAEPLFIGLDCSTQALKCSLLDSALEVLAELEVRFDTDLSHFGTRGGTTPTSASEPGVVTSPVLMIVEALDMLCDKMRARAWPLHLVRAVSAAGQQHASVFWSHSAPELLRTLRPVTGMAPQLAKGGAFSRAVVPNWQDSSTSAQCRAMEAHIGGAAKLARITGSRAHERFTGPQIARFRITEPEAYQQTYRISLVSSALTTLLCADGEIKGIDESDACGMNLWDLSRPQRGWNERLLAFVAGETESVSGETLGPRAKELAEKLGHVESDTGRVVGKIGSWFVQRYGFAHDCVVCPGTGDNPATYLSFVLGDAEGLVSLGTSDTVLVSANSFNPHPEWHTFTHPAQIVAPSKEEIARNASSGNGTTTSKAKASTPRYFAMLVYKSKLTPSATTLGRRTHLIAHQTARWPANVFATITALAHGTRSTALWKQHLRPLLNDR